jgi:hypothetical protein
MMPNEKAKLQPQGEIVSILLILTDARGDDPPESHPGLNSKVEPRL